MQFLVKASSLLHNKFLRGVFVLLFWLFIWQGLAFWVGLDLLLPGPLTVGRSLFSLLASPAFWQAAGASLYGILLGFFAGVLSGTALAVLTWRSPLAHALLSPFLRVVRTAPVASFIILALLWLSSRTVPMVISALMVAPILWGATETALREADPMLLELAQAYQFSPGKTFRLIYLPAVLPHWMVAAQTAMGLAWKSGIAAEVIAMPSPALGTNLYRARLLLHTEQVFAFTAFVIFLAFLLEKLFTYGAKRLGKVYQQ